VEGPSREPFTLLSRCFPAFLTAVEALEGWIRNRWWSQEKGGHGVPSLFSGDHERTDGRPRSPRDRGGADGATSEVDPVQLRFRVGYGQGRARRERLGSQGFVQGPIAQPQHIRATSQSAFTGPVRTVEKDNQAVLAPRRPPSSRSQRPDAGPPIDASRGSRTSHAARRSFRSKGLGPTGAASCLQR
jgi:hypothetical protein